MAWFDYVKNLGQGVEQVGQNISNRQVLDAEQKRRATQEMRATAQESRSVEEFEREKVKYLLDTAPDDWTTTVDDPVIQQAVKLGFKTNLRPTGDGKIGIAETPERKQRKLTQQNLELTHQKLVQDFGEERAKLERQNAIRESIKSGNFYNVYKDPQLRKQELVFAGLPEILAYRDAAEKQKWDRIEAENQGGVMAARINAGADVERAKIAAAAGPRGANPAALDMDQFSSELGREADRLREMSRYQPIKPTEDQINQQAIKNIMQRLSAYPGGQAPPQANPPIAATTGDTVNMVAPDGRALKVPRNDVQSMISAGAKLAQ